MKAPSIPRSGRSEAVGQLTARLRRQIEAGHWRQGARLPSLRQVAAQSGLSCYGVLAAYQELVGQGLLEARHGSGFYLTGPARPAPPRYAPSLERLLDTALLIRGLVEPSALLKCGSGSLPREWLADLGLQRHIRSVAAQPGAHLHDYGGAQGYPPLREALQRRLERRGITCAPDQIVLTNGISHGLELVVRALCRPGDLVLVERPAYYNLFGLLHLSGLRALDVERLADGPDLAALEALLKRGERPRLFILQSQLHNPTGTSIPPASARRILELAEQFDFLVAEDDAYADLAEEQDLRLAALDGLRRVIYLGGFTKTLSASLRVGYTAAAPEITEVLGRVQLLTSIASSEFNERVVYRALTEGYDRFTALLRQRLQAAREAQQGEFQQAGWQLFPGARRGMFAWVRHPDWTDSVPLAKAAAAAGFWLAPGGAFDLEHRPSPWVRFNVAYRSPALLAWLKAGPRAVVKK